MIMIITEIIIAIRVPVPMEDCADPVTVGAINAQVPPTEFINKEFGLGQ